MGPTTVRVPQSQKLREQEVTSTSSTSESNTAALAPVRTHVAFSIDHETGDMYIRVIDNATREIIRQIPPEEFVRIASRLAKMVGLLFDERS